MKNIDKKTLKSFDDQWVRFDQSGMSNNEAYKIFKSYFSIFPSRKLSASSEGFDMGCGSGRWAKFVAPKVRILNCIDPSEAIRVAQKKLKKFKNIKYYKKSLDDCDLKEKSQDFGYSLGVLHHVPNTQAAINTCVKFLKPGAPFLLYIYYYFDNRPDWFKLIWHISNLLRLVISKLPKFFRFLVCDLISIFIYYPIAKFILLTKKFGFDFIHSPLYSYQSKSFYVMRTDARDRFGTPLEKRYTKKQIFKMMKQSGLEKIKFKKNSPFWTVIGFKKK
jgi:SAM-dependent methyltransferase